MIQSVFISNNAGDIIIEKHYRGLLSRALCDYFWNEVSRIQQQGFALSEVPPVICSGKYYLMHIQRGGLFILAVLLAESPPLLILEYLHRMCDIFQNYFDTKTLQEQTIRDNFVTVYQLLDEMMDNGMPFTTEPNTLMELIPPPNIFKQVVTGITGQSGMTGHLGDGTLSNTPWRKQGVKYASNEIYFDIIEQIDAVVETNGMTSSVEISGEIQCQSKLSGMPDLSLAFTNPYILDDVSFHPCVRYNRYEQSKIVSFVPPDGSFKLMNYRVKGQIQLPVYVKPQITLGAGVIRVNVLVGSKVPDKTVEDMVVTIPFPKTAGSASLSANFGAVNFDDNTKICKWTLPKLPKDSRSPMLEGTVTTSGGSDTAPSSPSTSWCSVEFKILMLCASGLKVDALTLLNERYKPYKGVRSLTKAGKFHVRT